MKLLRLLAPCLVACLPSVVQAGDCGWAMATLYGYGGGWNNRPMVVNNFTPPYFSMHPPVYYGERYYRPYGDSPFASWPQLQANPAYMPQQQAMNKSVMSIENPHYAPAIQVAPQSAPAPAEPAKVPDVVMSETKPRGPITIENPYFSESAQFIKKGDKAVAGDKH